MIARRTFLIGLGAALTAPVVARAESVLGPVATAKLSSTANWRILHEIIVSPHNDGNSNYPIRCRIGRLGADRDLLNLDCSSRGLIYWSTCGNDEYAVVFPDDAPQRITLTPAASAVDMSMIVSFGGRPNLFVEKYLWRDGNLLSLERHPLDAGTADHD